LSYHVAPGLVPSVYIKNGADYETVEGTDLSLEIMDDGRVMIGDATVISADFLANNAIAHEIDAVLTIPVATTPAPTDAPTSSAVSNSAFGFAVAFVGAAAILV
jgi:hypothetical protein